ncbi:MAG: hypothetical protein ACI4DO_01485 [Roseburia sp.]
MQKEIIYQIMNGDMEADQLSMPGDISIVDEFADGRECGKLYDRVYAAKLRLEEKLDSDQNRDLEEIISCMNQISKILALKMFDYGAKLR